MKNQHLLSLLFFLSFTVLFTACNNDDDDNQPTPATTGTFTVTIENVVTPQSYLQSGTIEAVPPGQSISVDFQAGKGHFLSFATMLAQTNDLFYAPDAGGIALYDDSGNALTGDITAKLDLWDAGTEVNQEPGVGADQAPRQSGPNTGAAENGTVQLIEDVNDGFTYPADEEVFRAELAHDGETGFTLTLTNISDMASLTSPLAPGVYVVHGEGEPLFTANGTSSAGLEGLAEDGDNVTLGDELATATGYDSPLAPGVWAVHNATTNPIFDTGEADRGEGLEELAEDGDPSILDASLATQNGVSKNGVFNTPTGAASPGPLLPGNSYSFTFSAEEGDYLSLATMLVHTNDLFFGFEEGGIALFENGSPISGDLTAKTELWDAGTEVNEYPGAGNNQPVRGGGNSGPDENGNVIVVNDGFTYPAVNALVKVKITVTQ